LNKQNLIDAIADQTEISKVDAGKVLKTITDSIECTLNDGGQVALIGFGTFSVKDRAARVGRNPQTGAEIQLKASRVVNFKAGKVLKESVN